MWLAADPDSLEGLAVGERAGGEGAGGGVARGTVGLGERGQGCTSPTCQNQCRVPSRFRNASRSRMPMKV